MNSHKNAKTTFAGRKLLIERIKAIDLISAAETAEIRPRTARNDQQRL